MGRVELVRLGLIIPREPAAENGRRNTRGNWTTGRRGRRLGEDNLVRTRTRRHRRSGQGFGDLLQFYPRELGLNPTFFSYSHKDDCA